VAARHDDIGEHKLAEDYTKSHSGKVKDVMTRHVVSVTETASIANIAFPLETNRIKRVPAVRGSSGSSAEGLDVAHQIIDLHPCQ
jgi:CBS domain-containing protein